ncbi:MAG: DUF167 domain-containing protein [Sedimentisphaerales bacterium]|nr:DUF167 domain-containing protein [Sedimentisphaerales bacterium]
MAEFEVEEVGGGVKFTVKVVPGSSKTALCGVLDGMLKVKVAAAPEKGKANKCLTDFLAKQLGIKKNDVAVCSGQASPIKQIQIRGVSKDAILKLGGSQKLKS